MKRTQGDPTLDTSTSIIQVGTIAAITLTLYTQNCHCI